MFWLNVDIPTKTWTLHKESCSFCKPQQTDLKGLEEIKEQGGWLKFDSYKEAHEYYSKKAKDAEWKTCSFCRPK